MNSQILEKIEASGVCGIKKAELKKIFGTDCEPSISELAKEEKIIVDNKKGVAHYVWSKDNYLSHLSQNDPKFKILSRLVKNLENTITTLQVSKTPENNHADFQVHFDKSISELSSSLGWVSLSSIRSKVCESLDMTSEKFYSLTSALIEQNQSKYEISTGGQEGIHVRGMLHGYVRKL